MKVAILQTNLIWENPKANRYELQKAISKISQQVDLIVLPEMFTTGFTMFPNNVAETMNGETILWMREVANLKQAAICGSIIIKENSKYYNRFVFLHPNGTIDTYDKRHLFSLAGEQDYYSKGTEKVIISYKDWKICPQICYDLRFPAFSRNSENYDLLIYVANWPKQRIMAWDALLKARAIENMSFVIGVNRIGFDGNKHEYVGHSGVFDELGYSIINANEKEGFFMAILDKTKMLQTREKLNFLIDKDIFKIEM
uniref:amidohydrolase n=1 Tax=Flavobacterium sp. TaxID=239 RepID=UPI0040499561